MNKNLIGSVILSLCSVLISVFLFKYSLIIIFLYFSYSLLLTDTKKKFLNNWLLIYSPFFLIQSLPLIIYSHINKDIFKNISINIELTIIINVLIPVFIYIGLILKHYKLKGLLIVIVGVLVILSGFYSWTFQTFIAGCLFLGLSLYLPLHPDDSYFKNFRIIYLPIFIVYTLNPVWEPIFSGAPLSLIRLNVLPVNLIIPISILLGLKIRNLDHKKRLVYLCVFVSLFALIGFIGYPNWFTMINQSNKLNGIPKITLISETNDTTVVSNSANIVVLSVWSTSCGVCYKELPEYQKLVNVFKNNPKVNFYSVNIPLKRDDRKKTIAQIKKDYDFLIYFADDSFKRAFKIDFYPTMIIIKNNKIRYSGLPEFKQTNYYNCYKLINNLLEQ